MTAWRRNAVRSLAAIVVAASFAFVCVEANTYHTDDGCDVELHCFSCHWTLASTGIAAVGLTFNPILTTIGFVIGVDASLSAERPAPPPAPPRPPPPPTPSPPP